MERRRDVEFRRTGGPAAFTLVEVLIVIACAGIIAAAAFPGLARVVNDDQADRAAWGLAGAFRFAQAEAVRSGRAIGVEAIASRTPLLANGFDDGNWFRVYDHATSASLVHPVRQRPYQVDFDQEAAIVNLSSVAAGAGGTLTFNPLGDPSMSGASYVIEVGDARRTITVRGATGWVVIQ